MAEFPTVESCCKTFEGRIEQLNAVRLIDKRELASAVFQPILDDATDRLILNLYQRLVAGPTVEEVSKQVSEFQYPLNAVEHFKQEFLGWKWVPLPLRRWVGHKWPVKNQIVRVPFKVVNKVTRMCPHIQAAENRRHVRWLIPEPAELNYQGAADGY